MILSYFKKNSVTLIKNIYLYIKMFSFKDYLQSNNKDLLLLKTVYPDINLNKLPDSNTSLNNIKKLLVIDQKCYLIKQIWLNYYKWSLIKCQEQEQEYEIIDR